VELSIGVSHIRAHEELEIIEGVSQDLEWEEVAQGASIRFPSVWGWAARIGLGGEVRLLSRWGLRATGWSSLEGSGDDVNMTFGLNLSIAYYQYIRLF
jgi:hypothetical protein